MNLIRIQGPQEQRIGIYYEYDADQKPLGVGGMGTVYAGYCKQEQTDAFTYVAIKKIKKQADKEVMDQLIQRGMLEASVQVDSENLTRMWGFIANQEFDQYTQQYDTNYYVIMELLDGVDLEHVLEQKFKNCYGNEVEPAAKWYQYYQNDRTGATMMIIKGVLKGLNTLHEMGYIHRDIDPSNIMITGTGDVKIIDFGICKQLNFAPSPFNHKLTQHAVVIGKTDYGAPEICNGDVESHNVTTDIYALGVTLYQLLVGKLPFIGTQKQVRQAQCTSPMPIWNVPDIRMAYIVKKATEKDQADRYQTAAEMLDDMDKSLEELIPNKKDRKRFEDDYLTQKKKNAGFGDLDDLIKGSQGGSANGGQRVSNNGTYKPTSNGGQRRVSNNGTKSAGSQYGQTSVGGAYETGSDDNSTGQLKAWMVILCALGGIILGLAAVLIPNLLMN